jgi:3D (Asp-Asp-Asp) domain-containing protein
MPYEHRCLISGNSTPRRRVNHMKSFSLPFLLVLLMAPCAFAREDSLLARVTVYWARGGSGSDRYTRHHRCATGGTLREGHCAVDPRHIPYGSRVLLPTGETLAAVDTGTAVKNRKAARLSGRNASERNALVIDRFFETKSQALSWANRHPLFMPVKVVHPGSAVGPRSTTAEAHPSWPVARAIAVHSSSRPPAPTGPSRRSLDRHSR